jgi:hypothetical protein
MKTTSSISRLKFILIPLLGAILLAILFWPESQPKSEGPTLSTDRVARRKSLQAAAVNRSRDISWNHIPRTTAREFNPFLSPHATPQRREAQHENGEHSNADTAHVPAEIPPNGEPVRVQAIVKIGTSYAALINGRLIRVGDQLPGRGKVSSISLGGVVTESD